MAQDTSDELASGSSASEEGSYDSSEFEEETRKAEANPIVWVGVGSKQHAVILFRPESIITTEKKLKSIGEKYHMAYKMVKTESKLVRSILQAYGFHEVHPNCPDFNLMWTGAHLKPFSLRSLTEFQRVNHFPRSYEITRKDRIYKNIDRMAHSKGAKHFDFIPKSYLMPSEYQDFCSAYVKEKGSWIVKPIASSRGRGIYLINNPNQVPLEDNIMVCRYISNPLLIDGFKFDVRVYVAVTSYDPLLIYLFEEGLTRFATVKYERTNRQLKNQMMHLTNYSINKKSHDYVRCDDPDVEDYGNKWSMSAMLRYLKQEGIDTALLMSRIEAVIIKSIIAAELPIATACRMFVPHRENCIELYGFDILIDENLKPWLLEGNLSPSLACDAPLDLKIKSSVVADFFSLAGFHCTDPVAKRQVLKKSDAYKRPYSASKSGSLNLNNGNSKRPSSATSKENVVVTAGLSQEENRVIRFAKEQYQRRGGFVRIFPTTDTWEQYSSFLEYKTSFNQLLAQRLFSVQPKGSSGPYSAAVARVRSVSSHSMMESRNQLISKHLLQYERKLLSLDPNKRKPAASKKRTKGRATPVGIDKSYSHASADINDDSDCNVVASSTKAKYKKSSAVTSSNGSQRSSSNSSRSNGSKATLTSETSSERTSQHSTSTTATTITSSKSDGTVSESSKCESEVVPDKSSGSSINSNDKGDNFSVVTTKPVAQRMYTYKTPQQNGSTKPTSTAVDEKSKTAASSSSSSGKKYDTDSSNSDSKTSSTKLKPSKALSTTTPTQQSKLTQGVTSKNRPETILEQLKSGANLSKVQARHAFSAYLSRVQYRLMFESDGSYQCLPDVMAKQEEQMDLVLRFLKRAAGNLRQSFSVTIPSHKLPINDRKRILAKQLGDFVHIYNKETENMLHHHQLDLEMKDDKGNVVKSGGFIGTNEFKTFVSAATETELEEILTTYTHRNKSASVFLGASRAKTVASAHNNTADKREKATPSPYNNGEGANKQLQSAQRSYSLQPDMSELSKNIVAARDDGMEYHNVYGERASIKNPISTSSYSGSSGFYHGQTISNEEAIADALQRLSERQAARKYSASSQLNNLSQHLTTINLANMANGSTPRLHPHTLVQQRASSLPDLANADPCIQSMIDPAVRENEGKTQAYLANHRTALAGARNFSASMKKLSEKNSSPISHSQMLAQQSRELLQQSKAKHLAMVAAQVHSNNAAPLGSAPNGKPPNAHYMSYFSANNKMPGNAVNSLNRSYTSAGLHMLPPTPPPAANWGDNRAFVLRKTMGAMRRPNSSLMSSPYGTSKYEGTSAVKQVEKETRNRTVHNLSTNMHNKELARASYRISKVSPADFKR